MVECEAESVQGENGPYRPKWIITTYRSKGRLQADACRLKDGEMVQLVYRGRVWDKKVFPKMGENEEQVFWNEFAAYKAQWLKRKQFRLRGR